MLTQQIVNKFFQSPLPIYTRINPTSTKKLVIAAPELIATIIERYLTFSSISNDHVF